jgi:hypothetical protein
MAERKVLNKYIPPDFDPAKVPRRKASRTETKQMKVRMMLPMSVRCSTCGNYMSKGSKFNVRMEDVKDEDYLGIKIFRFYYKCKNCSAEFCMKTDPKSADYIVEAGATRNYEAGKEASKALEEARKKKEQEEKGDAMKALENRTLNSKRELDMVNALDEMKSLRSRHEQVDLETALRRVREGGRRNEEMTLEEQLEEEDEMHVQMMLLEQQKARMIDSGDDTSSESGSDDLRMENKRPRMGGRAVAAPHREIQQSQGQEQKGQTHKRMLAKRIQKVEARAPPGGPAADEGEGSGLGLFGAYGSESD